MNILFAQFSDADKSSVTLETQEAGSVAVQLDGKDVSGGWRKVWEAWAGKTSAYEPPAVDHISEAESWIAKYFSTARLLQMKVWWDTFPHEVTPKLAACFQWADGVTRAAIGGSTNFAEPPHNFNEIATESLSIPIE